MKKGTPGGKGGRPKRDRGRHPSKEADMRRWTRHLTMEEKVRIRERVADGTLVPE